MKFKLPEAHDLAVRGVVTPRAAVITVDEMRLSPRLTSFALVALAILHFSWGKGSTFPFRDREKLADAVIGSSRVPPPRACFAVAGALTGGAALVANVFPAPVPVRRIDIVIMAAVFGSRGALGLAGTTALVSPGSDSDTFLRLDRRVYSPLCLALAVGSLLSMRRPQ